MGFLKVLRWLIAVPLFLIIFIVIIIGIPAASISSNVSSREQIKLWAKRSGVYENFLNISTDFLTKSTDGGEDLSLLVNEVRNPNTELGSVVSQIVTPKFLQEKTNIIIDAVYDFFEGKTQKPTFKIVITEDKELMKRAFIIGLKERIKGLPECEAGFQIPADLDPMKLECIPPGLDLGFVDIFINQNINDASLNELLQHATFDSETIKIDAQTASRIQQVYSYIKIVSWVILALVFVLSILMILIIPNFKTSFKVTGIFIGATAFAIIFISLLSLVFYENIASFASVSATPGVIEFYNSYAKAIVKMIYFDIVKTNILYSFMAFVYGLALIGISTTIRSKAQPPTVLTSKPDYLLNQKA